VVLMGRSAGGQLALLTAYTKGASTLSPGCEGREDRDIGVVAVVGFYPPTNLARSPWATLAGWKPFLEATKTPYLRATASSRPFPASTPKIPRPSSSTGTTTR
jgi:acetyl esterase/lipase